MPSESLTMKGVSFQLSENYRKTLIINQSSRSDTSDVLLKSHNYVYIWGKSIIMLSIDLTGDNEDLPSIIINNLIRKYFIIYIYLW